MSMIAQCLREVAAEIEANHPNLDGLAIVLREEPFEANAIQSYPDGQHLDIPQMLAGLQSVLSVVESE